MRRLATERLDSRSPGLSKRLRSSLPGHCKCPDCRHSGRRHLAKACSFRVVVSRRTRQALTSPGAASMKPVRPSLTDLKPDYRSTHTSIDIAGSEVVQSPRDPGERTAQPAAGTVSAHQLDERRLPAVSDQAARRRPKTRQSALKTMLLTRRRMPHPPSTACASSLVISANPCNSKFFI